MLFSSFEFILGYLPITLAGFYLARRFGGARLALGWLTAASLFFYGWWNPTYLLLLVGSVGINYIFAHVLAARGSSRLLLASGVAFNLALIGYFKYAGFLSASLSSTTGIDATIEGIVLPLAISFFTFQQIAYLVDVYKGRGLERDLLRYFLFVSFFPQLIAGPIVHHREMLPQFISSRLRNLGSRNLAIGGTIFVLGLGKKVILADGLAPFADGVFDAAFRGEALTFFEAWSGALSYTFQIYFDFSGYSDMALGLAAMFGIRLPINFNSPYKAGSIIEFWRRWHITLSRFLREYLYIALGGNRKGVPRRYANLMITMLLGGLWHGAGWTFVAWGGLHGLFLVTNHVWLGLRPRGRGGLPLSPFTGRALTFFVVVLSWVFFRAENFDAALGVLTGMAGLNGIVLSETLPIHIQVPGLRYGLTPYFAERYAIPMICLAAFISMAMPNVQEIMGRFSPAIERLTIYRGWLATMLLWRPNLRWSIVTTLASAAVLFRILTRIEPIEFLYFQF